MNLITRRGAVALAAVLALTPALAACGDDDEDAGSGTTQTTAAAGSDELCTEVYAAPEGEEGAPEDIDARGAPTMEACDDAVDELQVIDAVTGTGAEVQPGDVITAHYTGVLAQDGEQFDSSWDRGEAATFPLDQVIPGWTEGLVGMNEGGRRTLVIPAELGYGANPPPGSGIPPDSTLVFTVDLVAIEADGPGAGGAGDGG